MKRKRNILSADPALVHTVRIKVRFSEVDSMRVVWHGEYVRYFEDGREAFGEHFAGLSYRDIHASGYTTPIVEMHVEYKRPLHVAEHATVETRYVPTEAAKICFEYVIRRETDGAVAAIGTTTQVFVNDRGEMELSMPEFFKEWKRRWNVL